MILDEIAAKTKLRVEEQKGRVSLKELAEACEEKKSRETDGAGQRIGAVPPFEAALRAPGMTFICEVKKASPSKGVIARDFPYVSIAREYEEAGAGCISVLTEPYYFQGSDAYLKEIKSKIKIPVLRKDFIVDEYMIYEAALMGADCILLICAILSRQQLQAYYELATSLGLSVLVETHDEEEIAMALSVDAAIIGVNNRNLKDFTVDFHNSIRLRPLVPKDRLFVSESGIRTPEDIACLGQAGVDAVLIGETMMRGADKKATLAQLKGALS
jgi:indole-3-glycerol phosphate synthase